MTLPYRYRFICALFLTVLALSPSLALEVPPEVKALPVQYQGRVMPFESFAREQILSVTGKLQMKGESPSATALAWMANPSYAAGVEIFNAGYEPMLKEVGLDPKKHKHNLDDLLTARKIMQLGAESAQIKQQEGKPTRVQSEAEKLLGKMGSHYALLTSQIPAFIPPVGNPDGNWAAMDDTSAAIDSAAAGIQMGVLGLISAFKAGNTKQMADLAREMTRVAKERWNPGHDRLRHFDTEVLYNQLRPIQWGRLLYLIALLLLLGSLVGSTQLLHRLAGWVIWAAFLAHLSGLGMRAVIGARAPWSNFYESLITITAAMVAFGLIFSRGRIRPLLLGGTAFAGYAALLIADNAGLTPGVDTLVPALQSYWLNIHVIIILSGYAVATTAMILGHGSLGVEAFRPLDKELYTATTKAIHRSVQMAVLLLFAGTILGGIWAHEAWGRYWGWDPKETWALISWFGYLGVAHARYAGWLNPRGLALAVIGVYPLILMTYYGVNYLLSGLHSYAGGESAQIPPLLIGFLVFEAIVVIVGVKGWHTKFGGPYGGDGDSSNGKDKMVKAVVSSGGAN